MSLEKVKVSFKIDPEHWVLIKAKAKAEGVDPAVILRREVGKYAHTLAVFYSEARKLFSHQGLDGVPGGTDHRFARNLSDDSDVESAFEEADDE